MNNRQQLPVRDEHPAQMSPAPLLSYPNPAPIPLDSQPRALHRRGRLPRRGSRLLQPHPIQTAGHTPRSMALFSYFLLFGHWLRGNALSRQ